MSRILRVPISAKALHCRSIRLYDKRLESASLFPFFDPEGVVEHLMLVRPDSSEIVAFRLDESSIRVPLIGSIRVDLDSSSLRDLDSSRSRELAYHRWHHDPWWVLREPRFEGHPALPFLMASNSTARFEVPISQLYFAADLARASVVLLESGAATRFKRNLLPNREEEARARHHDRGRWRLSPVWTRQNSRKQGAPKPQETT